MWYQTVANKHMLHSEIGNNYKTATTIISAAYIKLWYDCHVIVFFLIFWLMCLSNLIFESIITQMYFSSSILHIYLRSDYKPTPDVLFSLSASTCICLGET